MIPTFDIWLEDARGRQYRRANHYQQSGDGFIPERIFRAYYVMCARLNETCKSAWGQYSIQTATFNH